MSIIKKKRKISVPARFLAIINLLFVTGLLIGAVSPYISPDSTFSFISIIGIGYPVLLIFNVLFILFWLIFKPKYIVLSLAAVLLSFNMFNKHFRFNAGIGSMSTDSSALHVMTYNVQYFNHKKTPKKTAEQIANFVKKQSPDFICLQEFNAKDKRPYDLLKSFSGSSALPNYLFQKYYENGRQYNGLAIFSKLPIVGNGILKTSSKRIFAIYLDLQTPSKDTIRVFNIHFESIKLKRSETDLLNMTDNSEKDNLKKKPKAIIKKLQKAYNNRTPQIIQLTDNIKKSPFPTYVCGDFNEPPSSWAYHQVYDILKDSFLEKGFGSGISYNGKIPLLRIDYIFVPEKSDVLKVKSHRINFSDHYPQSSWVHP